MRYRNIAAVLALALTVAACGGNDRDSSAVFSPEPTQNIVETAASTGTFNTLIAAVEAAGLAETLRGDGPYTVFAPTDAAFAQLPEGTVEALLLPENRDDLIALLSYHVVSGEVLAAEVVTLTSAGTIHGNAINISVSDGAVMVDGANVVQTDIISSNGVIHVIDSVINP